MKKNCCCFIIIAFFISTSGAANAAGTSSCFTTTTQATATNNCGTNYQNYNYVCTFCTTKTGGQQGTCSCQLKTTTTPTPTPTPTPTSPFPPTAGAALVPATQKNVQYTGQSVNSTPIPNYDYSGAMSSNPSLLQECPNNIGDLTYSLSSYTDQPTLADINGNMPAKSSSAPPDQCYVKSQVNCGGLTDCGDPTQIITDVTLAVCPSNYTQVGTFDFKPEIRYKGATTLNSPDEITNMADWQFYTAQGFDCSAREGVNTVYTNIKVCIPSGTHTLGTPFEYDFNHNVDQIFELPDSNGVVFLSYVKPVTDYGFYGNQTCTGTKLSASAYVTYSPVSINIANDTYPMKITFSTAGSLWLNFPVAQVTCAGGPVSNWYFTTHMAPRGLICAKVQSTYHPLNK